MLTVSPFLNQFSKAFFLLIQLVQLYLSYLKDFFKFWLIFLVRVSFNLIGLEPCHMTKVPSYKHSDFGPLWRAPFCEDTLSTSTGVSFARPGGEDFCPLRATGLHVCPERRLQVYRRCLRHQPEGSCSLRTAVGLTIMTHGASSRRRKNSPPRDWGSPHAATAQVPFLDALRTVSMPSNSREFVEGQ